VSVSRLSFLGREACGGVSSADEGMMAYIDFEMARCRSAESHIHTHTHTVSRTTSDLRRRWWCSW
jgi:hypothetical protein